MPTAWVIGCDPSAEVRQIWSDTPLPGDLVQHLKDWCDLSEVELTGGDSIVKIARREHRGATYTWIGLYALPPAYTPTRAKTFLAAGLLLSGSETVSGADAAAAIEDMLLLFIAQAIEDGRFRGRLSRMPLPMEPRPVSFERLVASTLERSDAGGLSATASNDATIFVDIAGASFPGQIAFYLDWAQFGARFHRYHTALIGVRPADDHVLKAMRVVDHRGFLAEPPAVPSPSPAALPDISADIAPSDSAGSPGDVDYWSDVTVSPRSSAIVGRDPRQRKKPPGQHPEFVRGLIRGAVVTAGFTLLIGVLLVLGTMAFARRGSDARDTPSPAVEASVSLPSDASDAVRSPLTAGETASARSFVTAYFDDLRTDHHSDALRRWAVRPLVDPQAMLAVHKTVIYTARVGVADAAPDGEVSVAVDLIDVTGNSQSGSVTLARSENDWKIVGATIPAEFDLIALARARKPADPPAPR